MRGDHGSPFSLHYSYSWKNIFFHNRKITIFCLVASFGILWSNMMVIHTWHAESTSLSGRGGEE
jgi:hypothetical protein